VVIQVAYRNVNQINASLSTGAKIKIAAGVAAAVVIVIYVICYGAGGRGEFRNPRTREVRAIHMAVRTDVRQADLVGTFACPEGGGPFPGVLALGGSDGGIPEYFLSLLVPEGFACLALAYFNTPDTQRALVEVPLERIERGLRWLGAQSHVLSPTNRLGVIGASKGGELALLVASTFPDLVGPIVAYTPSSVAWAGIDFSQPRGSMQSSWSLAGRPLDFVPYPTGVAPASSERGLSALPIYDRGLDNAAAVDQAIIPIERATGPVLLVSGGDDRMWPAERMCAMTVERARRAGRDSLVPHLNYPDAGHVLFPLLAASPSGALPPLPFDLGGTSAAAMRAHAAAWPQVVRHLRNDAA
jgi:dienelactone hydrolase